MLIEAMSLELNEHENRGNFVLIKKEGIPQGSKVDWHSMVHTAQAQDQNTREATTGKHASMCIEDNKNMESTTGKLMLPW